MPELSDFQSIVGHTAISCGVKQLYGFYDASDDTPEKKLISTFKWAQHFYPHRCAFYIFSDKQTMTQSRPVYKDPTDPTSRIIGHKPQVVESQKYGDQFAEYIVNEGLGEVVSASEDVNPNSHNTIKVWIWKVNHDTLTKWCAKRGVKNCNTK